MRRLMRGHSSGQSLILFALALPVLFAILALVIDLGIATAQLRGLQNAADAGVMAGAKIMAESVTQGQGTVVYGSLTNQVVHDRAISLGAPNRVVSLPTFAYATAVQFRDCSPVPGSLGFTAASDAALVAALGGTRLASSSTNVPNNTCSIKVNTQVTFPAYFAVMLGYPELTVGARAAARIAPTAAPTQVTGFWPVTHWSADPDPSCNDEVGSLCTFWDSNAPPGGTFKEVINLSRYSDLFGSPMLQHWRVDYDHRWPGNTGKLNDLPEWVRNGWQGTAIVDEGDVRCQTANLACPNSKFEVYGGNMGNNIASEMNAYINDSARREGIDPVRGAYASINVFFWRYGEQGIVRATDRGTVWGTSVTESPSTLQRIILQKVRRFRFYTSTVSSSSVKGYFVSFYNGGGVPQNGPPSTVANTVVMAAE